MQRKKLKGRDKKKKLRKRGLQRKKLLRERD